MNVKVESSQKADNEKQFDNLLKQQSEIALVLSEANTKANNNPEQVAQIKEWAEEQIHNIMKRYK